MHLEFHRADGSPEFFCNFSVAQTSKDKLSNLLLALCKREASIRSHENNTPTPFPTKFCRNGSGPSRDKAAYSWIYNGGVRANVTSANTNEKSPSSRAGAKY